MRMMVHRADGQIPIDADWNRPEWQPARPIVLAHFMGGRPAHFPKTEARIGYDDQALYVMFRVEDRYVRAVARAHQDDVCTDSCVEFFFTPGTNLASGYFNLEMNCGGTILFRHQTIPLGDYVPLTINELEQIDVAHSLPSRVDPEVAGATTWTVAYRLPINLLTRYDPTLVRPAPGVAWRGNFYKCADETSHPHWLTWAPVDHPEPNFHIPSSFGILEFE